MNIKNISHKIALGSAIGIGTLGVASEAKIIDGVPSSVSSDNTSGKQTSDHRELSPAEINELIAYTLLMMACAAMAGYGVGRTQQQSKVDLEKSNPK